MSLKGKKALVTGGSRGIGAAIAKRLAAEGADVAITYAGNETAANETVAAVTANGVRGLAVQANAGDPASQRAGIERAIADLGGLDILIQNAGVAEFAAIADDSDEGFDRQFAVNVKGLQVGLRAAAPHLPDGGRIVLIGSVSGDRGMAGAATYGATKGAVSAFARSWARELAARNILVNTVQPGPIDTDMNPADGELAKQVLSIVPLGRYGHVDEIAATVAFLAGDDASYITGTTINVDGGYSS